MRKTAPIVDAIIYEIRTREEPRWRSIVSELSAKYEYELVLEVWRELEWSGAIRRGPLDVLKIDPHQEYSDKVYNSTDDSGHKLYSADPDCHHVVISASGGGVKCAKCTGWFCY